MIHQGCFGGLDVLVGHAAPPACLGGGASEAAKSFSLTGDGTSGSAVLTSTCCCGSGKAAGAGGFQVERSAIAGMANASSIPVWALGSVSRVGKWLAGRLR